MKSFFRHKEVVLLTGLLVFVSFGIAIISILLLYINTEKTVYQRLEDIVRREKSTVTVFSQIYHFSEADIINHLKKVRKNDISIGKNGEITFVKIENGQFKLLIYDSTKNDPLYNKENISITTPMFMVLQGKSGSIRGTDIKGVKVFAVYTYVENLHWGIIAKIPASEINKPFITVTILVLLLSTILISICTYLFIKITNPIIDKVIANEQLLKQKNKSLNNAIAELENTRKKLEKHEQNLVLKNDEYEKINKELQITNYELLTAKDEAQKSEKKLQDLNSTKDKMFSIIAHDLRSPFNSILGYSDLLLDSTYEQEASEAEMYLNIIQTSAKNTLNLLDNLLSWAKSQTGQLNFRPEKIILSEVIHEILEISNSAAKIKNISLAYLSINNYEVFADENMLQTILRNLVSNAIKFTKPKGKVDIYTEQTNGLIEIRITDNGIGMDEKAISELFVLNVHESSVGTRNERGSGLGLLVCKEFIEKNGGTLRIESKKEIGSSFIFTLPAWKD
jgi:signal transduction histidine kinase